MTADDRARRRALTAPERAAWRVSVRRGLGLAPDDLAALVAAALAACGVADLSAVPAEREAAGPEVDPVAEVYGPASVHPAAECRRCGFSHSERESECPRWPDPVAPGWSAVAYLPAAAPHPPGQRARSGVYHRLGSCVAGREHVVTRLEWAAVSYGLRPCGTCCPPTLGPRDLAAAAPGTDWAGHGYAPPAESLAGWAERLEVLDADPPDPDDYDPGPEVDDEGGMSERRPLDPGDDLAGGAR